MKKRYVILEALRESVEDGRIRIWVDYNGVIYAENTRKKEVCLGEPGKSAYGEDYKSQ